MSPPLTVYTARVSYGGADRLDVTRKTGGSAGAPFAPSWSILGPMLEARRRGEPLTDELWNEYVTAYTAEMRTSWRLNRQPWDELLAREVVTLVCYCTDPDRCHRRVLAGLLDQAGAVDGGERP